jgi:hypothetical protein
LNNQLQTSSLSGWRSELHIQIPNIELSCPFQRISSTMPQGA